MKIVELQIDESSLSGFEATAFVENPAIEQDFIAFNKVKMADLTHNDYPIMIWFRIFRFRCLYNS